MTNFDDADLQLTDDEKDAGIQAHSSYVYLHNHCVLNNDVLTD